MEKHTQWRVVEWAGQWGGRTAAAGGSRARLPLGDGSQENKTPALRGSLMALTPSLLSSPKEYMKKVLSITQLKLLPLVNQDATVAH